MHQPLDNANYSDVAAFLDAVNLPPRSKHNAASKGFYFDTEKRAHFYGAGCDTARDVLRLMANGWPEGRARMQTLLDGMDTSSLVPRDTRRRLRRCELGDAVNIGDVYAGRWQTAWTRATRQSAQAPQRVDLLVDVSIQGGRNHDELFWRGAAAIALCDMLESAGYMVRIVVGFSGVLVADRDRKASCRVTVKDYDKPLDVSTASAVMLPGFFRALGLAWMCNHSPIKCSESNGRLRSLCGTIKTEEGELLISSQVSDENTAKRWLATQLNRLGACDVAA